MLGKKHIGSDWENNWGSSLTIKITAPILWALIFAGLIIATIVQSNLEEKIKDQIKADADRIAYASSEFLISLEGSTASALPAVLEKRMADSYFRYGEIQVGSRTFSVGSNNPDLVNVIRQVPYSHTKVDGETLFANLQLHHPPITTLINQQRKSLLLKIGIPFLLFALGLASLIRVIVIKPIFELVNATKAVSEGDMSLRLPTSRHDEFGHLSAFFNQMLDHIQQKQQALSEAVQEAQASSQAKSTFLANMSHEIRTPLTAIIGFSDMLKESESYDEENKHQVDSIIRAGKHLQEIINDILDLSKIEAGQLDIEQLNASPLDVIKEVDELISPRAAEKGLDFKINYHFPIPKTVKTDPTRLKQILLNLLSNAVKFTNEGTVEMQVSFLQTQKLLRFTVIDAGIGIGKEEMPRLFKPFTQADTSTTRQFGGTGLGLCISKQLANKLGGDIVCESQKGIGSKFTLDIAIGDVDSLQLVSNIDRSDNKSKKQKFILPLNTLSGRVLLAEDTPDNQRLISMYLRRTGITAEVVENGQQALEKGLQEDFDLIFMDMQMPIMGGLEATERLRVAGYRNPIVALTANALKEDREKCVKAGANDYLTKPLDLEKFYQVLSHYLNNNTKTSRSSNSNNVTNVALQQNAFMDEDLLNDPEFQALVQQFIDDLPQKLEEINQSFASENWIELKSLAHKLKGTGSSFGFPIITDIAARMHADINNNTYTNLGPLLQQLQANCDTIVQQNTLAVQKAV
ncbi:ATP-binding protein [Kaarinaea lacus]